MRPARALLLCSMLALATAVLPPANAHDCTLVHGRSGACVCPAGPEGTTYRHVIGDGPIRIECTHGPYFPKVCPPQPVHTYVAFLSVGGRSWTVTGGDEVVTWQILVLDTNTEDCDGDGLPETFDGDFDLGVGGAFFGHGAWVNDPDCDYGLNEHGGNVVVSDAVFGPDMGFFVGEDDQGGPVKIVDSSTGLVICETSGSITPGDPATDPTADADDCLSEHFVGSGQTCGTGGGDGGYWVLLDGVFVDEHGGNVGAGNPPTTGTITAY